MKFKAIVIFLLLVSTAQAGESEYKFTVLDGNSDNDESQGSMVLPYAGTCQSGDVHWPMQNGKINVDGKWYPTQYCSKKPLYDAIKAIGGSN